MDGQSLEFTYNRDGIRTSKIVDGVEHIYTLNGSQIVSEEWSNKLIIYFYDESGSPIGFAYRTTSMAANTFYYYVYEKNLQGDIVAIYNTSGTKLVSYTYDAYGKATVTNHNVSGTNIGAMYNSFRYRGYYYDTETGLYYLNSRYYDPDTGRFINADTFISTGQGILGNNMYAYCNNNSINLVDYYGNVPRFLEVIHDFFNDLLGFQIKGSEEDEISKKTVNLFFVEITRTKTITDEETIGKEGIITGYIDATNSKIGVAIKAGDVSVNFGKGDDEGSFNGISAKTRIPDNVPKRTAGQAFIGNPQNFLDLRKLQNSFFCRYRALGNG